MKFPRQSTIRAIDVAKFFLWLAENEPEPTFLTPLAIQKLVYYAQGWAVAEWGTPLFAETLEAWVEGPVVREVWNNYQGKRPIIDDALTPTILSDEEQALVRAVWSRYRVYSPIALSQMTHDERPWLEARGDLADDAPSSRPLSLETMAAWFKETCAASGSWYTENWSDVLEAATENTRRLRE